MSEGDERTQRLPGDDDSFADEEEASRARENGPSGTCELCGGPTVERHCKIVCTRCGYRRDCSDP